MLSIQFKTVVFFLNIHFKKKPSKQMLLLNLY